MEEGPAVQAMTLNLTLNARRCLVGWGRGVGSHLLASYFFFVLLLLASYFFFMLLVLASYYFFILLLLESYFLFHEYIYCEHQDHEPYC